MPVYQIKNSSKSATVAVWKVTESKEQLIQQLEEKKFVPLMKELERSETKLKQWLAVRLLLYTFFDAYELSYNEYGKPFLDQDCHLSISHSEHFVAVHLDKQKACGIDIQKISDKVDRIKHKFLSKEELSFVDSSSQKKEDLLTMLWGAKEALYKVYGKRELIFNTQILVDLPTTEWGEFKGHLRKNGYAKTLTMKGEKVEGFALVYTL